MLFPGIRYRSLRRYDYRPWGFCILHLASVTTIKNCAFDNCTSLASVTVPATVTTMVDYVFGYGKTTVVLCTEGSAAHTWCKNYHQPFELI